MLFRVFSLSFFLLALFPLVATEASDPQEATPEIRPSVSRKVKSATPGRPEAQDLAALLRGLEQQNQALREALSRLESRLQRLEARQEELAKRLGVSATETLDQWHERAHRSRHLLIRTDKELENWHLQDHRRRYRQLEGNRLR